MILVADSGSTKAHWRLVDDNGTISKYQSIGLNPLFIDTPGIIAELEKDLTPHIDAGKIKAVYFYGASCSSAERCAVLERALTVLFPSSDIFVDHDMLAAARALCGNKPGFAAILGTGSNTCYYDGAEIIENIPALGYILGDEGSGAYIGRMVIRAYIYQTMPAELVDKFDAMYGLTKDDIFTAVYSKPLPNRFLAQFATFGSKNLDHPFIWNIAEDALGDFFTNHICRYDKHTELPVGFVGSIAHHFEPVLRKVAAKYNVTVGQVIGAPIEELTQYHIKLS